MSALSALYGHAVRLRRSWYERHPAARRRLAHPVISVGNLTVGGSGKTPVAAAIATLLLQHGRRPAILSRGYGRRRPAAAVVIVSDGSRVLAPVSESGDEPQLLARALPGVPVLVCRDRYQAGRLAEDRFGADVLILDDGFQHLQLARTIDLLLVAPEDLAASLLPAGRLREPLAVARRADAVIVDGPQSATAHIAEVLGVAAAFTLIRRYQPLQPLAPVGLGAVASSRPGPGAITPTARRIVAVAAIARPERFFTALREQGYDVAETFAFRDHHWFTSGDVARVAAAARAADAQMVVTTEKDATRLEAVVSDAERARWAVLPMAVTIEPAAAFAAWVLQRL